MTPNVSVIIPCFERPLELRRALESVLAQTHASFEVVVGDDGSEADLQAVVDDLADDRLRLVRREHNGGIGAARNSAIAASRAPLLSFLDSDDEWLPDHLAVQLAALERSGEDVDAVTTGFRMVFPDGRSDERIPSPHSDLLTRTTRGVDLSAGSTMLIRRASFDVAGPWPEDIRRNEDYDWFLRAGERGLRLEIEPQVTVVINSDDRAPLDLEVSRRCWALILERHGSELSRRSPALRRHLRAKGYEELAWAAWRSRRWAQFARYIVPAVLLDPGGRAPKLARSLGRRARHRLPVGVRAA